MKKNISLEMHVTQIGNMDISDLDGEKIMMDLEEGNYFALDEIGTKIWDMTYKPIKVKDIIAKLMEEYEVKQNDCQNDVIEFLRKLSDAKLVQVD